MDGNEPDFPATLPGSPGPNIADGGTTVGNGGAGDGGHDGAGGERQHMVAVSGYAGFEELGRGGFATVYRARQVAFDRTVVVKVLHGADFSPDALRRFHTECRTIGSLDWHPHIVVVYDAGTLEAGTPYLVMEYLPGGSLEDRLEAGPLPWADVVGIGVQLADALEAAHRAGVLHRDVKPGNVLLDRFGECKLADFGIATVAGSSVTTAGVVTATVAYAGPEILGGERATVTSDVYGLGATLFALLAGRAAFVNPADESGLAILQRIASLPVPDLRPLGVPDAVASLVERSMAKRPEDRPPSAEAFADALQQVQRDSGLAPTRRWVSAGPPADAPTGAASAAPLTGATLTGASTSDTPGQATAGTSPPPEPGRPADRRLRRWAVMAAVGFAALVAAVIASRALMDDDTARLTSEGEAPAATTVPATTPPNVGGAPQATSRPTETLTAPSGAAGRVVAVIDARRPGSLATLKPEEIAVGEGAVWIIGEGGESVSRIDPTTNQVAETVDLPHAGQVLAAASGSLWVLGRYSSTVMVMNARSLTAERTLEIEPTRNLEGMAVGEGSVWVVSPDEERVLRLDAVSGATLATVKLDDPHYGIAVGAGAAWVTNTEEDTVSRIDPATNSVVANIRVGDAPYAVAVGDGAVWVANGDSTVSRIDPATNAASAPIRVATSGYVPPPLTSASAGGVAVGEGAVWVLNATEETLSRIDPRTNQLGGTVDVGRAPSRIAAGEGGVWVVNTEENVVRRIAPAGR
jgi:YVTN family beta-propeller protein